MLGALLGNYRVVEQLGEGGMGVVYVGRHAQLGHRVAVKVLQLEMSRSAEMVKRFFNEAQAATAIRNPGIVQIYDFGTAPDGRAYFVMELLEGESLTARLKQRRRLSAAECCRIGRQVANVLAAAHAAGITHRDLKPDNLFLVGDPEVIGGERVKVLDFGIAKLTSGRTGTKTRTGLVMGTPSYMAPEQCRNASAADARSDIYALGCVLFRMACGRPPFLGKGLGDIVGAHLHVPPPDPQRLAPELPPALARLLLHLLEKQPDARPQTMAAVSGALDEIQRALGGAAARTSAPRPVMAPPSLEDEPPTTEVRALPPPPEVARPEAPARAATPRSVDDRTTTPIRPLPATQPMARLEAPARAPTPTPLDDRATTPIRPLSAPQQAVRPSAPQQAVRPSAPQQAVRPSAPQQAVRPSASQQAVRPSAVQQAVRPSAPPLGPSDAALRAREAAPAPVPQLSPRESTLSAATGTTDAPPPARGRRLPFVLGGLVGAGALSALALALALAGATDDPAAPGRQVPYGTIVAAPGAAATGVALDDAAPPPPPAALAMEPTPSPAETKPAPTASELEAECRGHQAARKWDELARCADRLAPLDPARAAELTARAASERRSGPRIAAVEAALRSRNLRRARAELDQVSVQSVEHAPLKRRVEAAEAQAITELAARLGRARDLGCAQYDALLARERASKPARVIDEAARRAPCAPAAPCDADALAERGLDQFATGQLADALVSYEAAYACRPTSAVAQKAFLIACNLQDLAKARAYWRLLSIGLRTQALATCVRNGISEAKLDAR